MAKTVIEFGDLSPNWLEEDRIRKRVRERIKAKYKKKKSPDWKQEPNWGDNGSDEK